MAWKVANYNNLKQDVSSLQKRYQDLQRTSNQTKAQLAELQLFANEVSVAYGLKSKLEGPADISEEGRLVPSYTETLETYNVLKSANFSRFHRQYAASWHTNTRPNLWPLEGHILSPFGERRDPFKGGAAFHSGVDISAFIGTPVKVAADGIVVTAEYSGAYGKLVVVQHGNGLSTFYGHLSRIDVIAGQDVRMGQVIALSGATGRVTAPHLHYEVRSGGAPINPYNTLSRSLVAATPASKKDFPFQTASGL
jgi:murein DD-endopeptidase MepM/ murein hydrolase activator NlpD